MKLSVFLVVCTALVYRNAASEVHFSKCQRRSPNLSQCLIKSLEEVQPFLKQGMPEYNIPRLEPFKMRQVELDAEMAGLTLKGEASNIVAFGAGGMKIKSLKLDLDNYSIDVHVYIPRLEVTADYDCYGSKLYVFNINGSGQFKATFTGLDAILKGQGHGISRDGKEYVKLDDLIADIRFADATIDIVPDLQTFTSRAAAKFINTNPTTVMKLVKPVVNKAAGPIIKKYLNKVTAVLPLNELLTW